jgi:hypothetical protein
MITAAVRAIARKLHDRGIAERGIRYYVWACDGDNEYPVVHAFTVRVP